MPKITRPSIATNAILEQKVRKWEISPTCDSRPPQLIINIRAANAHSMPPSPTATPAAASACASRSTSRWCTRWCEPAFDRPSGPLNVFDPWSKLFYKYIHVRRGWPSLGQVHSEFGSELEQPLASRLHWTKGRNMSDKLSKNTQKSQNFIFRQHLSDFGEFTWHPNDCPEFFLDGTNQCPKIIIVTFLLSFLTVTPRGTLDFKALYVTLCVCVCQNPSWYPILIVYDHRPIALSWSCCWT